MVFSVFATYATRWARGSVGRGGGGARDWAGAWRVAAVGARGDGVRRAARPERDWPPPRLRAPRAASTPRSCNIYLGLRTR